MKNNFNSFFASPFYINAEYAQSLIPSLYKNIILGHKDEKSEKEKENECLSIHLQENGPDKPNSGNVVIISIKQPIQKFSDYYYIGSKSFMNIMAFYEKDPNTKGIVLDIDSGGGQVYGTGEFYDYIKSFSKPVVAYTDGYMCSAAYYIGNATNYIIANKRADHIGSIGAYATIVDFNGIMEKFGAKIHEMYATDSEDKNSDYREVLKGNHEPYIKNVLDPIVAVFHEDMKSNRSSLNDKVFKGGTWNGIQALEMGLVDELGTIETAINKVFELSNPITNQSNINMSQKKLPKVEAVLGLTTPLAITENGSYLNEQQLDQVEAHLESLESQNTVLNGQLEAAQNDSTVALQNVQNQLNESQNSFNTISASIDDTLLAAGLPVEGMLLDKLAVLNTYATQKGAQDGSSHTKPKIDANGSPINSMSIDSVDVAAALNN